VTVDLLTTLITAVSSAAVALAGVYLFVTGKLHSDAEFQRLLSENLELKEALRLAASVFFQFSRLTSEVAAWTEIGMLGGVSLAMAWRTWVFEKVHKRGKK
jgi:hypothetical protein